MVRRALTVLALLLMTAVAVVAALRQRMEADVRGLLARATEAETKVSYNAVRSIQFGERAMRLRIVHQAPDRTQIEPVDGWRSRGDRGSRGERDDRGARGERGPRGDHEERGDHGPRGDRSSGRHGGERGRGRRDGGGGGDWRAIPIVHVDLALRNYDATADGASVRFTPRYVGRPTLSMTFDEATGLLTGWEVASPGGTARLSTESLEVADTASKLASPAPAEALPQRREWDRGSWGGGTFDPERDPGPKGFDLILPRELPEGFQLHEARLMQRGEWESVRLVWTDGIALVCLTEFDAVATGGRWGGTDLPRPEAGKVVVERRCHEGTSLLRGRVGDTGFVVIGSIEEAELTGLISSLETRPVLEEGVR